MCRLFLSTCCLLALAASAAAQTFAGWLNEVDYDRLHQQYNGAQASGSNVPVTLVESGGYPDTADGRFAGKTLTLRSGPQASTSHATVVAAMFFGNTTGFSQRSVAPGIANVDLYNTAWEGTGFLSSGTAAPGASLNLSRVASHAYGSTASTNVLSRMDWLVQADDFVQVVGSQSVSNHGHGFNSIAVAPTAGVSGSALNGTSNLGGVYTAGRYRPDLTGPHGTTSDSIGAVAGAAALLISLGKGDAGLSQHSYAARPGYTVRSAETAEVIKAALMAGAVRDTGGANTTIGNITNYRLDPANRTSNGLDKRYGAGMLNVYNSYQILAAGETNSTQDGGGPVGLRGFDYDPAFGGAAGSNTTATYTFTSQKTAKLQATLAWNLKVTGANQYGNFEATSTLYDLDLSLVDLTAGGTTVQLSGSTLDNTESLYVDLLAGHQYAMQVTSKNSNFAWDYGLAWQITPVPEPTALSLVALGGWAMTRRRRRLQPQRGVSL